MMKECINILTNYEIDQYKLDQVCLDLESKSKLYVNANTYKKIESFLGFESECNMKIIECYNPVYILIDNNLKDGVVKICN